MTPTLRPATSEDAEGIARVHVDSWRETYRGIVPDSYLDELSYEKRTKTWRETLIKNDATQHCTVAADPTGEVIGFTISGPRRAGDERFSGEIYAIYLLKKHHAQGIGRALFQEALLWLSKHGHDSAMIWVLEDNPTAQFYERMGGKKLASQKINIGKPLVEISYGWSKIGS